MNDQVLEGEKHFTASVWILNKGKPKKMLLVHHKKLGKWLQPGGHIERFENPVQAAIREIKEETGIDIGFLKDQVQIIDKDGGFLPIPKFFLEETIPANENRPMHYHLDINYVVEIKEQEIKHREDESHGIGWFTKEEILKLPIHEDTKVIVNKLM
jgi:8-oxo-dGTP diphosphatase